MKTDFNISGLKEKIPWNWLMFNILNKCTLSLVHKLPSSVSSHKWNVSFSKLVEVDVVKHLTVVSKVLFYSQFLTSWEFKLKNLLFLQIRPLNELMHRLHKKKVVYYWYHVCKISQRLRTELDLFSRYSDIVLCCRFSLHMLQNRLRPDSGQHRLVVYHLIPRLFPDPAERRLSGRSPRRAAARSVLHLNHFPPRRLSFML